MEEDLEATIARAMPSALKMALYTAKKQQYEILKYTIEGVDSLCNTASLLKDFDDHRGAGDDNDQPHLSSLEDTTKQYAVLEMQLSQYKKQLEKMEALVDQGKFDPTAIDKMVKQSLAKPKAKATKHDFYKRFCEKAGIELEEDANEDVVFQESESSRSTICPVTQLEIEKPLKNPSCNHTYSEQGIRAHLQRSKKCPVAGCPQKLSFSNLERNVEMEVLIARRHSRHGTQANASSAQIQSDGEEEEEEFLVE